MRPRRIPPLRGLFLFVYFLPGGTTDREDFGEPFGNEPARACDLECRNKKTGGSSLSRVGMQVSRHEIPYSFCFPGSASPAAASFGSCSRDPCKPHALTRRSRQSSRRRGKARSQAFLPYQSVLHPVDPRAIRISTFSLRIGAPCSSLQGRQLVPRTGMRRGS